MVADAEFGKPIVFKFIEKKNGLFQVTSSFTKNTAKNLEVSLHNNRIVYFQLFDLNVESLVQYAIRFENVHKKHHFLELLSIEDIPIQQKSTEETPMAVIHKKVSVTESKTSDFKILNMTYNMGQSDTRAFRD